MPPVDELIGQEGPVPVAIIRLVWSKPELERPQGRVLLQSGSRAHVGRRCSLIGQPSLKSYNLGPNHPGVALF